eukprot:c26410_g3_i1 orf=199-804(+)
MSETVFTQALENIPRVKSSNGDTLTEPFLEVCRMVLPVIDKFGTSMSLVKSDIGGNISRLNARYRSDTSAFYLLYDIVRKEVAEKTVKHSSSCTNGLLWLTRAMDFIVALFCNLFNHPDWTMTQAATDAYNLTLKMWHGWIASSTFTVALKLIPERNKFMTTLGGGNLEADIKCFITSFPPLLQDNHNFLKSVGCDDMKAS